MSLFRLWLETCTVFYRHRQVESSNRLINHLGGKLGLVDAGAHGSGSAFDTDLLVLDFFCQFLLVRFYVGGEDGERTEGEGGGDVFIEVEHTIASLQGLH